MPIREPKDDRGDEACCQKGLSLDRGRETSSTNPGVSEAERSITYILMEAYSIEPVGVHKITINHNKSQYLVVKVMLAVMRFQTDSTTVDLT